MAKILDSVWIKIGMLVDSTGLRKLDGSMDRLGSRIGGVAAGLTTVATLFAGLGAAAYSAGAASEKAFTRLETQIGLTTEQATRARRELRGMSRVSGAPLANLANAYFALESAGLGAAKSMQITELAAKGATAQYGASSDIAELLSRSSTLYPDMDPRRAMDQFAAAITYGNIPNAAELTRTAPRILLMSQALGISFGEAMSALSSLSLVMPNVTEAVTSLRGVLSEMMNPTAQARKIFEDYGITVEQVRKIIDERGIIKGIQWLYEAIGRNDEALAKIIERTEGYNAALAFVGPNAQRFVQIQDEVTRANGNLAEAFDRELMSPTTQITITMNKLTLALEDVWNKGFGPIVVQLTKLPEHVMLAVAAFAALQAVLVVFTMGGSAGVFGSMFKLLKLLIQLFRIKTYVLIVNKIAMVANFIVMRLLIGSIWGLIRVLYLAIAALVRFTATVVRHLVVGAAKLTLWIAQTVAIVAWRIAVLAARTALLLFRAVTILAIAATKAWALAVLLVRSALLRVVLAQLAAIAVSILHRAAIIAATIAIVAWRVAVWLARSALLRWTLAKIAHIVVAAAHRAAMIAATIAIVAWRVAALAANIALVRWTASKIANIVAAIAHRAAIVATTAATWLGTAATWAVTAATWAWNAAMTVGRGLVVLLGLGALLLSGKLSIATVALLAAKAAVWLLNLALYAIPIIGWIGALVAVGIALYIFRDQVLSVVRFVLGWLKSNWPLLLWILMGPFSLIYWALWKKRDQIVGVFQSIWEGAVHWFGQIASFVGRVFGWIGDRFAQVFGPIQQVVGGLGQLFGNIPGIGAFGNQGVRAGLSSVPVGAAITAAAPVQSSVRVDNINVNLEHGDSAEIAANVGGAIEDTARNVAVTASAGTPLR